jgi:hypothetical protein
MELWNCWFSIILQLRQAFSRQSTFFWFITITAGMTVRNNDFLGGVSSIVRSCWLHEKCYQLILDFFHSSAVNLEKLKILWAQICFSVFPFIKINNRPLLVADGVKIGKSGKKMPGIKLVHQASDDNSKAEFIMAHMCQSIGILIQGSSSVFCCPLSTEIQEGIKFSNRDKRTLNDKLMDLIFRLKISFGWYLVADAFYANKGVVNLLPKNCHLISRVRHNAVAYAPALLPDKRNVGRPKKYGEKIILKSEFETGMQEIKIKTPSKKVLDLKYKVLDLYWRPVTKKVRFILVSHSTKGKMILMGTDLSLCAKDMITAYIFRFKIEVSFYQQIHTLGAYSYRFWMKSLKPIKKRTKAIYPHKETEGYRQSIRKKLHAYHLYIHTGMIAQGLCQYLACTKIDMVFDNFKVFYRTISLTKSPSEKIVAKALKNTLFQFLVSIDSDSDYSKFIWKKLNPQVMPDNLEAAA